MPLQIKVDRRKIAAFCRKWKIAEFAFFGSVLREDFRPDSDIDVLVTFAPDADWSLLDFVHMKDELEGMFGRPVDLVSKRGLMRSQNYIRKESILSSAEVLYAA